VEEVCYAIREDSLQIRREGDNANGDFLVERGLGCPGVATEYNLSLRPLRHCHISGRT
jgi:hypothetical protein